MADANSENKSKKNSNTKQQQELYNKSNNNKNGFSSTLSSSTILEEASEGTATTAATTTTAAAATTTSTAAAAARIKSKRTRTCSCSKEDIQALASGGGSMCLEHTLPGDDLHFSYSLLEESAKFLLNNSQHRPKIGVICGSGLGGLATQLEQKNEFPYERVPNFPVSTVVGHAGKMILGLLSGIPILCMQGRFHAYEGYPLWKCAMPVRVMKLMGIEQIIVTNAAGGLKEDYKVGDIMIIKDHINMQGFAGDSPLRGRNDERFGPRFPGLNNSYDKDLRKAALKIATELGLDGVVKEGVYVMLGGPTYETVAELKLLKILGVDAVGMSTVPEVVVARHCGLKVFAFSLITNKCIIEYDTDDMANHEEVIECANARQKDLQELVKAMVAKMAETE